MFLVISPSCNIVSWDIVEGVVAILRCGRLRISRWILTRWNWFRTRAHRHWVEPNDMEHVVNRFESFVRSHSRSDSAWRFRLQMCVVKTKSIFRRLSSKTASKAELDVNPLAETSAEVWRSGMASSVRESRRGRLGAATFGWLAVELLVKFWDWALTASACDSNGSRIPILPGTDSTGSYRVLLLTLQLGCCIIDAICSVHSKVN